MSKALLAELIAKSRPAMLEFPDDELICQVVESLELSEKVTADTAEPFDLDCRPM
jgi:hypothetical protein